MAHKQTLTEQMLEDVKKFINNALEVSGNPPLVRDVNGFIRKKYGKSNYGTMYQRLWSYIKGDKDKCCFPLFYYVMDDPNDNKSDKRLDIYNTQKI